MKTLRCSCWCEADEVHVPVEWISEGRTASCSLPGCLPGCESRADDAFEEPWVEEAPPAPPPKRVVLHDYDPGADSSPGLASETYPGLVLRVGPGLCGCGCLEECSKKGRFRPGHDARLKGKLQRALAAEVPLWQVGPDGSVIQTTPGSMAEYYGWTKQVEHGADRIRRRSATPLAAEKRLVRISETERADGAEFLGLARWEQTGRAMASWRLPDGRVEVQYVTPEGTIETVTMEAQ